MALPMRLIRDLNLPRRTPRIGVLADGSTVVMEMYKADISWNGGARNILVFAAEGDPLIGMALLTGYKVTLEVVVGGTVTIETLSGQGGR